MTNDDPIGLSELQMAIGGVNQAIREAEEACAARVAESCGLPFRGFVLPPSTVAGDASGLREEIFVASDGTHQEKPRIAYRMYAVERPLDDLNVPLLNAPFEVRLRFVEHLPAFAEAFSAYYDALPERVRAVHMEKAQVGALARLRARPKP